MTRDWWDRRWFLMLLVIVTALPVAFAAIPPFIDLPAHLGRYAIQLDAGRSPELARYYAFRWHLIGNLGADLAIVPFARLFGLEAGLRLLIAATAGMSAAGLLLIARHAHGRVPATAFLALPLVYGYFLMFGFLNYCLGLALAYLAIALWLDLTRRGRVVLRTILFGAIALILWVAHIEAWAVTVLSCALSQVAARRRAGDGYLAAVWFAGLAVLPFAVALVPMVLVRGDGGETAGWLDVATRLKWLATVVRDRWLVFDLPLAAILFAAAAAGLLRLGRLAILPLLALPAAGLFFFYLALPRFFMGTDYAAVRLLAPALALLLLSIDTSALPAERRRIVAGIAAGIAIAAMAVHAASFALYDRSFTAQLAALDHVERGSAVVAFEGTPCRSSLWHWSNSRLGHIAGMAVARRHAFTNDQFALGGQQLLTVRYTEAAPFTRVPSNIVANEDCGIMLPGIEPTIDRIPRRAFRYAWLIDMPPALWPRRPWLRPVWTGPDAILYRILP